MRLFDQVVAYLRDREIQYVVDPNGLVVGFSGASETAAWNVYIATLEPERQVLVHSILEEHVPEDRRTDVALFLTRANFGIILGNFELDLDDGELRYKTSVDVDGDHLSEALLDNIVAGNVAMFSRYLAGIDAVIAGRDVADALALVEER
jgi:hypothetical protein